MAKSFEEIEGELVLEHIEGFNLYDIAIKNIKELCDENERLNAFIKKHIGMELVMGAKEYVELFNEKLELESTVTRLVAENFRLMRQLRDVNL